MKLLTAIFTAFFTLVGSNILARADVSTNAAAEPLQWDATLKEFIAPAGQARLPFFFAVTNVSSSNIAVMQVQTSCGCTVAKLPTQPWLLGPGEGGHIEASFDLLGRTGVIMKSLTVISSVGTKQLNFKVTFPTPAKDLEAANRIRNQEIAKTNRQAILKGECAQCHVEPAEGKLGRELYAAACGICHDAAERAPTVTDLHLSNKENNPETWRNFIKHGKVASLMPAFDRTEGGPLDDAQIESLVAYLTTDFQKEVIIIRPAFSSSPATFRPRAQPILTPAAKALAEQLKASTVPPPADAATNPAK